MVCAWLGRGESSFGKLHLRKTDEVAVVAAWGGTRAFVLKPSMRI